MKKLWLLRHGDNVLQPDLKRFGLWQPESELSEMGRADVAQMRDTYLRDQQFAKFFCSPYTRARDTAHIAVPGGDWQVLPTLAPRLPEVWNALWAILSEPVSLEKIEEQWPGFLQMETEWVLQGVHTALDAVQDGEQALLVSHQPFLGLIRGTFDSDFPLYEQSLGKAEIYRLEFVSPTNCRSQHLKLSG